MPRSAVLLLVALAAAVPASAQAQSSRDFLLGTPTLSAALRGGLIVPADNDAFAFTREQFTVGQNAFVGVALAGDVSIRLSPRVELVNSIGYHRSAARSETRDFVEIINGEEYPIEQVSRLTRVPLTTGLKLYVVPTGRSIGRFAWVPTRFAPYIGAGGGVLWHRFEMEGDFVDDDEAIFTDRFTSDGFAPVAQAFAGMDYALTPRVALTAEARYQWASAKMDSDFRDFDRMRLSGLQTTIGVNVRF